MITQEQSLEDTRARHFPMMPPSKVAYAYGVSQYKVWTTHS
jgi:hypothetical protein